MDRNQATGILLILLLLFVYFQFFAPNPQPKQVMKDTSGKANEQKETTVQPRPDTLTAGNDSLANEELRKTYGDFAAAATGEEKDVVLENQDIRITLNTKGGRIREVLLKDYQTYDQQPLVLFDEQSNDFSYVLPAKTGDVYLSDLFATTTSSGNVQVKANDSASVVFRTEIAPNQYIEQTYQLQGSGFTLDYDLKFVGLNNLLRNAPAQLYWVDRLKRLELDLEASRITSTINYYTTSDAFEQLSEASKSQEEVQLETPLQWVSLKQKFFLSAIIARNTSFADGVLRSSVNEADSNTVKTLEANLMLPLADLQSGKGSYTYYFGPNEFPIVRDIAEGFGENVYFGWPVVRVVNRYFIWPLFNWLETFIGNYGLLIVVLVLIIRIILLPLSFRSQLSLAKIRVLQPEIQEIKDKYGDDMTKIQQEQMKLYQQVGVNPLSGCIPVLLQMPILLALFSLFPNLIELRQKSFLWSSDLSTYDSVASLPFVIPYYGSHVSLFTILMTLSSVAYAYFNNQVSTVQGPMKSLQYIMPVMFMFILNSLPAGLTFYYFVGNIASITQQLIMAKFVDEDKIKRTLEENKLKNKDKKKSKFQQRLEEAMKSAEEAKRKR